MFKDMSLLIESLRTMAYFIFYFWPLIILAPLGRPRRLSLAPFVMLWFFLAFLRLWGLRPSVESSFFLLIPEPLNTILFLAVGVLLFALFFGLRRRQRRQVQQRTRRVASIEDLLALPPPQFESLIEELYRALGHQARRTGRTGDHGVDLVVKAKNGEKWVVQCKRWRGTVGEPVVRDFYGVIQHERAHKGTLITTGRFSVAGHKWAEGKPITLVEGKQLVEYLERSRSRNVRS